MKKSIQNRFIIILVDLFIGVSLLSAQLKTQDQNPVQSLPYRVKCVNGPGIQELSTESLGEQFVVCKLVETRVFEDAEKARVTLDVQMDWNDGSGYQLLLDKEHSVCGTWIPDDRFIELLPTGEVSDDFYQQFEYKIPHDANGMFADQNWIIAPGKESLEIDPGIYDYCVTNPTPGRFVYIASGMDAVGNDIEFKAGVEYIFTLVRNGNFDLCTRSVVAPVNMGILDILMPESAVEMGRERIKVLLENQGTSEINDFTLQLYLDKELVVEEKVSQTWVAGEKKEYAFSQEVDFSKVGRHMVKVIVDAPLDAETRNDTMEQMVYHIAPVSLPYVSNFDSLADFDRWKVVDANEDGIVWNWISGMDADENRNGGYAQVAFSTTQQMDDYLVTRDPLVLESGLHNMSFRYASYSTAYRESLQVYYGKTDNVAEMELLWEAIDYPFEGNSWLFSVIEWNQDEAGEYYFAFRGCSKPEQWAIMLDKVKIDKGNFQGIPDLAITGLNLPLSSCNLGKSQVGVVVTNKGTRDVYRLRLEGKIGGKDWTEQEFDCQLKAGSNQVFYFEQDADFTIVDSTYSVDVSCMLVEPGLTQEERLDNNTLKSDVVHFSPLEIPFNTVFSSEEDRSQWAVHGRDWLYDKKTEAMAIQSIEPMVSRCVTLKKGTVYTFSMNYLSGDLLMDVIWLEEDFDILYGESGLDMSLWDTLASFRKEFTNFEFVTMKSEFQVKEDGDYSFAFVPIRTNYTLRIKSVEIGMVPNYDVSVIGIDAGMSLYTPLDQVSQSFPVWVNLRNVGTQPLDSIQVSVYCEDNELSKEICSIDAVTKDKWLKLNVSPLGWQVGDTLTLVAKAVLLGENDTTQNNEMSITTILTDTIMAKDRVTEDMYVTTSSIGAKKPIGLGVVYRLNIADTLTALSLGWAPAEQEQDVFLAIYHWDVQSETMGDCIWNDTVKRGLEAGQRLYVLEKSFLLDSGSYLFEVRQLTEINFGLVVDRCKEGNFYVTTNIPITQQTNMGFPAYRLVFGRNGRLGKPDAALHSILSPADDGVFGQQEDVTVKVANLGYEKAQIPVSVWINNVLLGDTVLEINSYSTADATFYADMSEVGITYRILAVCTMDRDENSLNDTCRKEVRCLSANNENTMDISDILIYPNPASDFVFLSDKKGTPIESVYIYDIQGVQQRIFRPMYVSDKIMIDVNGLNSGIYILRIKTVDSDLMRKLVVR